MSTIKISRGTTYSIDLYYKKNDVAASLENATVRFTMKPVEYDDNFDDTTALLKKNIIAHTDALNGHTTVTINPEDTYMLEPDKYNFDIKVEEQSGVIYKLCEGNILLDGSPTNRIS